MSGVTGEPAGPADWAEILDLRTRVFVDEQGVPPEIEQDGRDARAVHAVSRDASGRIVATGRLLLGGGPGTGGPGAGDPRAGGPVVGDLRASIGRMATDPGARGRGHGAAVLAELHRQAVQLGVAEIELHAQVPARRFYERAGYDAVGDVYEEAGIPHVTMVRRF